jgi:phage baseplate assembly protein gpV
MNWSLYSADRATHLKVVVVGLTAALLIAAIGISATQLNLGTDVLTAQGPTVIKAGGPVAITQQGGPVIR